MGNGSIGIDTESIETQGEATVPKGYGGPKAFRALRHRNYRLFFFGQLISIIGTWMQATALPLLIVKLAPQNPGLWLGINGLLPLIPLIPIALIAGSLVDRYSKRTIIVWTQVVMMLQAFALAALSWNGTIQMWQILALTFIAGAATAIDVPARQAFVMEMVGDPDDLSSGIALNSAIFNLGRAIGPVLAGLLIATLDYGAAFLVNGLIVSGRDCRVVDDAPASASQAGQPTQNEGAPERRAALSCPESAAAGLDEPGRRLGLPVDAVHYADPTTVVSLILGLLTAAVLATRSRR